VQIALLKAAITQVSFTLHNSFQAPLREFTAPLYEVREEGWGEFDVNIKVCLLSASHAAGSMSTGGPAHKSVGRGTRSSNAVMCKKNCCCVAPQDCADFQPQDSQLLPSL
jgi:YEATS family